MAKLYNLAAMTVASTGTGTITLGSAATINGVLFLSFASAGVSNGETVAYSINDVGGSEIGTGTYTSAGTTLTRTPVTSTNANAAINMTSAAIVRISPAKADIANLREQNTFSDIQFLTRNANSVFRGVQVLNNDAGASAQASFYASNGTNFFEFGMRGTGETTYGALTAGRAFMYGAVDFVIMSDGGNFIVAAGGSTERMRVTSAGGLALGTTSDPGVGLIYQNSASFLMRTKTSWNNGAAAAAGTIANAPAAGNPTKWIPVDDNGTTRYIPAW